MQNRFTSKVVWISVLAQVIVILQLTNVLPQSDIAIIDGVVTAILEALVLFGILNNPTDAKFF
jgi:uncharacterized membrane protein